MKTQSETSWTADARQIFIPYTCKKTGEEKKRRIVIRSLVLTGEFIYTNTIRITLTKGDKYCAHKLVNKRAPLFQEHLAERAWAELDVGGEWQRDGKTMDEEECLEYLIRMLGRHEGERAMRGIQNVPISRL